MLAAVVLVAGCGQQETKRANSTREGKTCPRIAGAKALAWTDIQPLQTGGRLTFVTESVAVSGRAYVIQASVTNRTGGAVDVQLYPAADRPEYEIGPESFGIAYREDASPGNIQTRKLINYRASVFEPPLPQTLAPGKTWRGRFCGSPRHISGHPDWWIVYGDFIPGGHWVTDKTFATP